MADKNTSGFLEQLGLGNTEQMRTNQLRGGSAVADFANIARTGGRGPLTQLLGGAVSGVGGLISGDGGRGVKEFGRDFDRGVRDVVDGNIARDQGITMDTLRNRRGLREELKGISIGSGSLEDQINAATEVAKKANQAGDIEVALKAAQMTAQLRKQLQAQKDAGIASESAGVKLNAMKEEESIGRVATIQGREELGEGKAVRIDAERAEALGLDPSDIGRFLFVDKDGVRHVVDGVDVVGKEDSFAKFGVGGVAPKDDNILKMAAANGATSGNIGKMRGTLGDMGKNADILLDVSTMLQNMQNPEFALDMTGKTAIRANKIISFVDNATQILTEADQGAGASTQLGEYQWNGQKVQGPAEQHQQFMAKGKEGGWLVRQLNSISGDGAQSLEEYLPQTMLEGLRAKNAKASDIALIAEQYFANVMELAYMDARLQEPSNRGLSDKDITNALRRIGAATANPASFAMRQQKLLSRLNDAVGHLGETIRVPAGANTRRQDVVDFIYNPEVRNSVQERIGLASESLSGLRRGGEEAPVTPTTTSVDSVFQRLQTGAEVSDEELNSLTIEELQQLQERSQQGAQ